MYAGLWGYNASLCAIVIGGMFYVLSVRSALARYVHGHVQ